MAQGDSVYDIIDASDHLIMRTNLSASTSIEIGKRKGSEIDELTNVCLFFFST